MNTPLIKYFSLAILATLLTACGGSKLPKPTPLTTFSESAALQQVWVSHPNDGNDELLFKLTPAIENNIIYTAGNDGTISALDTSTGKIVWTQRHKDLHFSSNITATQSALYLGTDRGQIVKLDKANGAIIWAKPVPSTVMAAPKSYNNAVFAKTINGEITTLDAQTGAPIWNYQQTLPSLILRDTSDPIIQNPMVIVGFSNGALIAFDQVSGNILWTKQISLPEGKTDVERMADIAATPKVINKTVYAATYQGKLIAFDLNTRDTMWSVDISTYNDFSLSDTTLFVGNNNGDLIAVNRSNGAILWKQEALKYRYLTAPTYLGNDLVAIADKEGYLHILSAKDGHFVARTSVDSDGVISAPLFINGLVIVQSNDGRLYAYKILQK